MIERILNSFFNLLEITILTVYFVALIIGHSVLIIAIFSR